MPRVAAIALSLLVTPTAAYSAVAPRLLHEDRSISEPSDAHDPVEPSALPFMPRLAANARPLFDEFYTMYESRVAPRVDVSPPHYPQCNAPKVDPASQRVRRAFHTLSRAERDKVYAALWMMHEVPTWEGRALFGDGYLDMADLVMWHSVAVTHPEGDSAHPNEMAGNGAGLGFMPWHRAFSLVYENILLLVDPSIGAAPYWDAAAETHLAGAALFTPDDFGSVPGSGPNGLVIDGAFAGWRVPSYDRERFEFYFNRTMDSPNGPLWSKAVHAGRACSGPLKPDAYLDIETLRLRETIVRLKTTYNISQINIGFEREAALARLGESIYDWSLNMKLPLPGVAADETFGARADFEPHAVDKMINPLQSCWHDAQANHTLEIRDGIINLPEACVPPAHLHHVWHNWVAGVGLEMRTLAEGELISGSPLTACLVDVGDANDFQSSPNDPTFFFHHINIDRSAVRAQRLSLSHRATCTRLAQRHAAQHCDADTSSDRLRCACRVLRRARGCSPTDGVAREPSRRRLPPQLPAPPAPARREPRLRPQAQRCHVLPCALSDRRPLPRRPAQWTHRRVDRRRPPLLHAARHRAVHV